MNNHYDGIEHIVHISTNIGTGCEHCQDQRIGVDDFADSVNHYIKAHGYRLLHTAAETSYDMDGKPWHSTVAVVGM